MKITVYGDSIAAGLGARGRQFPVLVAELLGAELDDRTGTAKTAVQSAAGPANEASLVIIHHGTTDAMLRPSARALRLVPPRYREPGWMDRRPYYSTHRSRRLVERAESAVRWRTQRFLIRRTGVSSVPLPEYTKAMNQLAARGDRVLVLSHAGADSRYLPGTEERLDLYWEHAISATPTATHVDVRNVCCRWSDYLDDHFHPSASGHKAIAAAIIDALARIDEARTAGCGSRDGRSPEPATAPLAMPLTGKPDP